MDGMIDAAFGLVGLTMLFVVGLVTLARNKPGFRRPISVNLGLIAGAAKLGIGLWMLIGFLRDVFKDGFDFFEPSLAGYFVLGVLLIAGLLIFGVLELRAAVRAM
ncbi:hypothetical protein HPC49_31915 [Pyxidicoccus fallax]|uniref:Uncharacterized protein n=1 Tax=Pyxidicoccus fallax TaxID=394095 RepID=A0A848LUD1_9BACT|nr:hypothetical protein [Pyxidicoccus fallax]NMO21575.1 hypothetical protein [Pyxidicoccus fallax]NPC82817.1 hypothetical protein [Pyxidicoccus fallax]